jgi:long-subunit fatty acid transport protein
VHGLAQNCTFVQVFVHFSLNIVNFVCVNITVCNNSPTFATDFSKKMFKDMKKIAFLLTSVMLSAATTATAGGILTNTNQSIDFLRNPARDAAIGLDGVYSNPAGVAFLPEGFHLGINWQYAHQTRTIKSTNPYFALGRKNGGLTTKTFEGVADAPFIPSLQAAYNKGNWSIQFNFSIPGGGGSCEFADGLGSFESVVGSIANQLRGLDQLATAMGQTAPGVSGYDMNGYMQGRNYYFGFQLGAAYKINPNLAVYGGLRLLYGTATYKAKISNIMVNTAGGYVDFGSFLQSATAMVDGGLSTVNNGLEQVNVGMAQYEAMGATALPEYQQLAGMKEQLEGSAAQLVATNASLNALQKYSQGVNLLCNQSSVGVAPIVGIDWKIGSFNFAAKYEFKTQIRMKNESTVNEASEIPAVNKFRDGEEVDEDSPAQLALGAMWSISDDVRLNAGYHHFYDKDAHWYNNTQDLLDGGTNEFLAGVEWDINPRLTVSGGAQLTRYQLTDAYMNDMSFVVNSYSLGFGFNYKASEQITLKAGYFQTNYEDYERVTSKEPLVSDTFTRTNRVLGIGCELAF